VTPARAGFRFDRAELTRLAREAYCYFYPLVIMEMTRRRMTNVAEGARPARSPMNVFAHAREFPPAQFRTIVRPNFDTLYSTVWADVSLEPVIITVPPIADRFYMLPCYDMWTEVFASPGTRTNGSDGFAFALCRRDWRGTLPAGVERIDAPTDVVWVLGRIEARGAADFPEVHRIQDQLGVSTPSRFPAALPRSSFVPDETMDMRTPPMLQVDQMTPAEFFALAARLVTAQAPHPTDWNMLARLTRLGFVVGEPYELAAQPEAVQVAFEDVAGGARRVAAARVAQAGTEANGWRTHNDHMAVWGNSYLQRAMIARWGLGANPPEESTYPSADVDAEGERLNGARRYRLHFDADALPPVDAFWSLTAYDQLGYQIANPIDRFALGDRDPLRHNADGSLDLLIQASPPEDDWCGNWLPVDGGAFVLTLRLYLPRESALSGRWQPPPIVPVA
jgi:hypothetical protein